MYEEEKTFAMQSTATGIVAIELARSIWKPRKLPRDDELDTQLTHALHGGGKVARWE